MISLDEEALICDLAQYYHIYDYRELPPLMVAVFSDGLPKDSRIKLKMTGAKITLQEMLLALTVDRLGLLWWSKTVDGQKGRNRPESIFALLCNEPIEKKEQAFNSGEEFEEMKKQLINQMEGG